MRIELPLRIWLGKRSYSLTLNNYRNWHYHLSNKIKHEFEKIVGYQLPKQQLSTPIQITYEIHKSTKRRYDLDNLVVVAKFFHDTLVSKGLIEDDSNTYISGISFIDAGVGKNDKIVVTIKES